MAIDLYVISKNRTFLMGIAALLIIICHFSTYCSSLPYYVHRILGYGNLGVDIFLFLSGVGAYFSLSKLGSQDKPKWYKKRFLRIFIPYSLMQIPIWLYFILVSDFNLADSLFVYSTIAYWIQHRGAWFVALLVPLYLITPFLYKLLNSKNKVNYCICISLILWIVCNIDLQFFKYEMLNNILHNVQVVFIRSISFVIGMTMGRYIKEGRSVSIHKLISLPICSYCILFPFLRDYFIDFLLVIPAITAFSYLPSIVRNLCVFINWMGCVSLESYLANIYLCKSVKHFFHTIHSYSYEDTQFVEYSIIITVGLVLSYIINYLSTKILNHI